MHTRFALLLTFALLLGGITRPSAAQTGPQPASYATGDPWKVLVIVYREIDTDYLDVGGVPRHLTATMPADQEAHMVEYFRALPHRLKVYDFSDQGTEMEAHVVYADRPITSVTEVNGEYSYWPSPEDTAPEIEQFAPPGMYDSILIFWQAFHPETGQSIPSGGWGWGTWLGYDKPTYATIFNLPWIWTSGRCLGEVFLHEWLHGVTFFYMSKGVSFPYENLHGGEEAGYDVDENNCWENWLRDYMRGLVLEDGEYKGISPAVWQTGTITTYDIQGWRGEYFNDEHLSDLPVVVRDDAELLFEWGSDAPHPLLNDDHFSARWTRTVTFGGFDYRFRLFHDDGARLFIDNVPIYDNWSGDIRQTDVITHSLTAGEHEVRVELRENQGWASMDLSWLAVDFAAPDGDILLPEVGATLQPGPVPFSAQAWDDPEGTGIARVEFWLSYSDEWQLLETVTQPPYETVWHAPDDLPDQPVTFGVIIVDQGGNMVWRERVLKFETCKVCGAASSAWPMQRGNLLRAGRSPLNGPTQPALRWTVPGNGNGSAPAVGLDGRIYLGMDNRFVALLPNGETAWEYTAGESFTGAPALTANGQIYVPNMDGKLYAFSTGGGLLWTYQTGGWTISSPAVAPNGTIYMGSSDGNLYAFNPAGKLKWAYPAGIWINTDPAVAPDGSIYFGSTDQRLYALNPDGTLRWSFLGESYLDHGPAVGPDGTVIAVSVDGTVYGLDPAGGELKWKFSAPGPMPWAAPTIGEDGTVYIASIDATPEDGYQDSRLFAISPAGNLRWEQALPHNANCPVTLAADGTLYAPLEDGWLYALDSGGELKWKLQVEPNGRRFHHNPVIGPGGAIYLSAYWPAGVYAVGEIPKVYLPLVRR